MQVIIDSESFEVDTSTTGLTPTQARTLNWLAALTEPTSLRTALEALGLRSVEALHARILHLIDKGKLKPIVD